VIYRLTFDAGPSVLVDDYAARHFLRQAVRRGDETTRVRGGHVVTLAGRGGRMVALIVEQRETTYGSRAEGVVSVDPSVS
jgi:hypothetical protein